MTEAIRGDVLTKEEMRMRGIVAIIGNHGGLELRVQESTKTIAHWLLEQGFIEEFHYNDATIFMDLRRAYEASMGIKWRDIGAAMENLGMSAGEAAARYDAIRHAIGIKRAALIAPIIKNAMLDTYAGLPMGAAVAFKESFEAMSKGMREVKEKLKNDVAL